MSLSLDTLVLAVEPLRWVTMGELQDGDILIDERGQRTTVQRALDPVLPDRMYRMQFSTGEEVRVGGEHRWVTWTATERLDMVGWPANWAELGTVRSTNDIYRTRDAIHAVGKAALLDDGGWHQIVNIEEVAPEVSRSVLTGSLYLIAESFIPSGAGGRR